MTTRDVRFKCEGGCGAEWINHNHTRCEGCGHNRGPYSIGYHAAWQAATAAAEAKHRGVVEAAMDLDEAHPETCDATWDDDPCSCGRDALNKALRDLGVTNA